MKLFVSVERWILYEEKFVYKKYGIEVCFIWMYDENFLMIDSNCNMVYVVIRLIFIGFIGEGFCLMDSFVLLVSLYSCCYI